MQGKLTIHWMVELLGLSISMAVSVAHPWPDRSSYASPMECLGMDCN